MSSLEVFLWPLAGFLAVAALAGWWQSRNSAAEAAARRKLMATDWEAKRWSEMPQWQAYQDQQQDPARIARAGRRRAFLFAGLGLALLAYLLLTRS